MTWITHSVFAMLGFVVFITSVPFFVNIGVRAEAVFFWWMFGITTGMAGWFGVTENSDFFILNKATIALFVFAMTFGVAMNISMSLAVSTAPNPGVAMALINVNAAIVVLCAAALGKFFPDYYPLSNVSIREVIGVVLITVGIVTVVTK